MGDPAERYRRYRWLCFSDVTRNSSPESMVALRTYWADQVRHQPSAGLGQGLAAILKLVGAVWIRLLMGAELPSRVLTSPGLELPYDGCGVILRPTPVVGRNSAIFHRVTVGVRDDRDAPRIGDRVVVGAAAPLLGPIDVGAGARIYAGAVLVSDAAADATYVGVPARRVTS